MLVWVLLKALFSVLIHVVGHMSECLCAAGNMCLAASTLVGPGDMALGQPCVYGGQEES